jgi:hypothetical protein
MEQLSQEMRKCLDELFRDRIFVETTSLAKWLGVSAKTVRRLGDDGAIGWRPKGGSKGRPHRMYAREDVEAYLRGEEPCPFTCRGIKPDNRKPKSINTTSSYIRRGQRSVVVFSAKWAMEQKRQREKSRSAKNSQS